MSEGLGGENNADVGRVYAHPKAAIDREGYVSGHGPSTRLAQTLFLVLCGGLSGALIGSIWSFGLAGGVCGALTAGALRTAWLMFGAEDTPGTVHHGNARTEAEVRAALEEIKAQKK